MKEIFLDDELSELENAEVRGGANPNPDGIESQEGCVNTAEGCGATVDQGACVNEAGGCGGPVHRYCS